MYEAEKLQISLDQENIVEIAKVKLFAIKAHEGVRRKYGEEDYICHPFRVSENFVEPRMVKVALLHDVVEDTRYTTEDIQELFGLEVATGVEWLTNIPKEEGQNRAERTQINSDRLSQAPSWVKAIKTADIIDNMPSIIECDPNFAKTFIAEKQMVLDKMTYLKGTPWSYLSIKAYSIIDDYYKGENYGS